MAKCPYGFPISQLPELWSLNIDDNHIGDEGARILSNIPTLSQLSASNNKIGSQGAILLAHIRDLQLANNKIDDEGALVLASSRSLRVLDIRKNLLTQVGIDALKNNTNIFWLNTCGNLTNEPCNNYLDWVHHLFTRQPNDLCTYDVYHRTKIFGSSSTG